MNDGNTHPKILRRCGLVLIAVGALDIAYMIRCVANGIAYNSSFNIFALVGGILLVRGGLKTARWVATISTFMLAVFCVGPLVMPLVYPPGYWLAMIRHGEGAVTSFLVATALVALLVWVRRQVMHPEVRQAQSAAGLPPPRIKLPLAFGVALPVLLALTLGFTFRSKAARDATRRAEEQLGGEYRYVVRSMRMTLNNREKTVFAVVAAYNRSGIRNIPITWKE